MQNNLYSIVKSIRPTRVLEIGSLFGDSLWYWMELAPRQSRFMVIDKLVDKDDPLFKKQFYSQSRLFYEWANEKDHTLQILEAYSQDPKVIYTAYQNMNPVDFLFIKRDTTYNQVKSDFLAYLGLVRSGGIIAIENINLVEVNEFWKEVIPYYVSEELSNIGVLFVR